MDGYRSKYGSPQLHEGPLAEGFLKLATQDSRAATLHRIAVSCGGITADFVTKTGESKDKKYLLVLEGENMDRVAFVENLSDPMLRLVIEEEIIYVPY